MGGVLASSYRPEGGAFELFLFPGVGNLTIKKFPGGGQFWNLLIHNGRVNPI